jgi:hypothetical protein
MNPKNRLDNRQGLLKTDLIAGRGPVSVSDPVSKNHPTLVLCFVFLQAFLCFKEQVDYYLESLTGDETGDEISRSQEEIITQGIFKKKPGNQTSFLNEIGHH